MPFFNAATLVHATILGRPVTTSTATASTNGGDGDALGRRCGQQRAVSGNDDEVGVAHSIRGGEVDSVIATKTVRLGEVPCAPSEHVVDLDEIELLIFGVELSHRSP